LATGFSLQEGQQPDRASREPVDLILTALRAQNPAKPGIGPVLACFSASYCAGSARVRHQPTQPNSSQRGAVSRSITP
jgi:hypothetical protein